MRQLDLDGQGGRTLHAYDLGEPGDDRVTVMWHHGTPNIGMPPEPLYAAAEQLGIRWIGYDRPGYGGSTPHHDRRASDSARDAAAVADALNVQRFAVMSHSGGGPHALACAALLADRVTAAVVVAGLAPYDADGLDWYAGMAPLGEASLRAAAQGREAKVAYEKSPQDGDMGFNAEDQAAFGGDWSWFMTVVGPAMANGPGGLIEDDLGYVNGWGIEPSEVHAPTLLVHGEEDRIVPSAHAKWLAAHLPAADLWLEPTAGHISILHRGSDALRWLREQLA